MCYAWPGPRCSSHSRKALTKAVVTGDAKAIKKAKINYYLSPAGIKELREQGKVNEAQKFSSKRKRMINYAREIEPTMSYIRRALIEFEGDEYYSRTMNHIKHHITKYGIPEVGRTRAVFDRKDGYVIKVPINGEGFMANSREALTAQAEGPYTPVAKCWQEEDYTTSSKGVSVLIMEKVKIVSSVGYKDLPDWVSSVDCAQVGYNQEGQLVAYDL